MSRRVILCVGWLWAVGLAGIATPASGQILGTFSWQTQPYCNVLSITIIQAGPVFQVAGVDDQCGGAPAPLDGTALFDGNTVSFGLAVSLSSGRRAHLSSKITVASLSGPWADADGNSGTMTFAPAAPSGPLRPAPTTSASITTTQLSPAVYAGTGAAATLSRSDHRHDDRYYTEAESDAAFVPRANLLTAMVYGSGYLVRGIGAVLAVKYAPGVYEVHFNRDVTSCVLSATARAEAVHRTAMVDHSWRSPNAIFAAIEHSLTGVSTDNGVFVTVICP